jgi:hypothetical protein
MQSKTLAAGSSQTPALMQLPTLGSKAPFWAICAMNDATRVMALDALVPTLADQTTRLSVAAAAYSFKKNELEKSFETAREAGELLFCFPESKAFAEVAA